MSQGYNMATVPGDEDGADDAIRSLQAFTECLDEELREQLSMYGEEGDMKEVDKCAHRRAELTRETDGELCHTIDSDDFYKLEADRLSAHVAVFTSPNTNSGLVSEERVVDGVGLGKAVRNKDGGIRRREHEIPVNFDTPDIEQVLRDGGGIQSSDISPMYLDDFSVSLTPPQDNIVDRSGRFRTPSMETKEPSTFFESPSFDQAKSTKLRTSVQEKLLATASVGGKMIPVSDNNRIQLTSDTLKKNWVESYDDDDDDDDDDDGGGGGGGGGGAGGGGSGGTGGGGDDGDDGDDGGGDSIASDDSSCKESHIPFTAPAQGKSKANILSAESVESIFSPSQEENGGKMATGGHERPPSVCPGSHALRLNSNFSPSSSTTLRPQMQAILDDRVQGDYSAWQKGPRVSPDGLRMIYSGLVETAAENGKYDIILTIECLLRPDVCATKILETMTKVAKTSRMQKPGDPKQAPLRFTSRCDHHLIIEAAHVEANEMSESYKADRESCDWDLIDLQVCVSRQLRQRVMICQYMKQRFSSEKALSVDETTEKTSSILTPMRDSAATSTSAFSFLSEGSPLSPATRRMARVMQRLMTQSQLSFSCLFAADPTCVLKMSGPEGLDLQFSHQLETMMKEEMMTGLKVFFDDLEEKIQNMVEDTESLKELITPIFRQHGLGIDDIVLDFTTVTENTTNTFDVSPKFIDVMSNVDDNISSFGKLWCDEYTKNFDCVSTSHAEGADSEVEGLTKCVVALDNLCRFLSHKCSLKTKELQSKRSEDAVSTLNAINKFRRKLFRVLANSEVAQNSSLTKVFIDSFKTVTVTDGDKFSAEMDESKPLYTHVAAQFPVTKTRFDSVDLRPQICLGDDATITESTEVKMMSSLCDIDQGEKSSSKDNEDKVQSTTSSSSSSGILSWVYDAITVPDSERRRPKPLSEPTAYEILRNVQLVSPHLVVFCYGACLINNTPAKMYITPQYACFSVGFPGFTFMKREIYPISKLLTVTVTTGFDDTNDNTENGYFIIPQSMKPASIILSFSLTTESKDITVTPMALDCHQLRVLLMELKEMELSEYEPLGSDPKVSSLGEETIERSAK